MTMESPRPVLRIFEKDLAKSFYIGLLAFNLDWEHTALTMADHPSWK
ncbi:MAG TPA: glyoxalase superfamily protein [Edaphobacter sp.]|nr:glyoxalase superfamily protein [Edaphobacter sp.]